MRGKSLIPQEITTGKMRLVLLGREKMLVEQHRGLKSYETEEIVFATQAGEVWIFGKNLCITTFGILDAQVEGQIDRVEMRGMEA